MNEKENAWDTINIRTDLAVEDKEQFEGKDVSISGVIIKEKYDSEYGVTITKVRICSDDGAKAMNKPKGTYVTIEAKDLQHGEFDSERMSEVADALGRELKHMLSFCEKKSDQMSVLVVGLGNRDVTPDALGPMAVSNLEVNRHLFMVEEGKSAKGMSAMIPGVMAQSGMESAEMVSGIVSQIRPDVVIAIDALAARSTKRLNTTIQIADTGIHPGSGVGNHRKGLNRETLGIPVIAIGIPTVIDAATIVNDTMDAMIRVLKSSNTKEGRGMSKVLEGFSDKERLELIGELLEPQIGTMFVTPKDIDENIQFMAKMVAMSINNIFAN